MILNVTNPLRELGIAGADFPGMDDPAAIGRNVLPSGNVQGLAAPQIRRVAGEEVLAYRGSDFVYGAESDPRKLLGQFMAVADASDVQRFAMKYGPLELCRYDLPLGSRGSQASMNHDHEACMKWHYDAEPGFLIEPVDVWLRLAKRTEAKVRIAFLAQTGDHAEITSDLIRIAFPESTAARLISALTSGTPFRSSGPTFAANDWVGIVRWFLQESVDDLFSAWEVRPWFWWSKGVLVGMFTREFIPLQLAEALTASRTWAVCSSCRLAYQRVKRAAPSGPTRNKNYCPKCKGAGIDGKERQRAYRDKHAKGGQQ